MHTKGDSTLILCCPVKRESAPGLELIWPGWIVIYPVFLHNCVLTRVKYLASQQQQNRLMHSSLHFSQYNCLITKLMQNDKPFKPRKNKFGRRVAFTNWQSVSDMIERKYLWPLLVLGCSLQVNALATEIPANTLVTISMGNGIWPTVNGAEADEVTVAALATHESGFLAVTTTQMGVTFEEPGDYQLWLTGMRLGGTSENATVLHHEFTDRLIWTYNVMAYENFISRPPFVVRSFYALFGDYQVTEFFIARAPVPPPPPPPVPVPEAGSTAALLGMGMLGVGALSRRWRQFLSAAS